MLADKQMRAQSHAAFRFVVEIDNERQAAFTECSLPVIEWEVEEVKEGGLNTFVHQLPGRRKSAKVSLKNGVGKSKLLDWYINAISTTVARKAVTISLFDSHCQPVMVWSINGAYPIKWTGPQVKTDNNTIAIQTLELVCGEIAVSLT
jgi:phage tail-like protein